MEKLPEIHLNTANAEAALSTEWANLREKYQIWEMLPPFKTPDQELQKIYRVKITNSEMTDDFCKDLYSLGYIQYAEPAQMYTSYFVPDDVNAQQQWYFDLIKVFDAWDIGQGNASVTVAIVDDAVKSDHPDLAPVMYTNTGEVPGNGLDDDGNGFVDDVNGFDVSDVDNDPRPPSSGFWQLLGLFTHGTHCAGIAGAATHNGQGIASVGNGISIIPVKATSNSSLIPLAIENGNEGVDYAVAAGARVISMSWGGATQDSTLTNVIQAAVNAGAILVSAAGNDGNTTPNYPSALPGVIAVGSVSRGDIVSSFSQRGSMIDVMAPGDSIWSTLATSAEYGFQSGTSMACPMVAGLCGLMLSQNPGLTAAEVETCLKNSCDNIDLLNPGLISEMGAGRINALTALSCPGVVSIAADYEKEDIFLFPNPGRDRLYIRSNEVLYSVRVTDMQGRMMYQSAEETPEFIPAAHWPAGMYMVEIGLKGETLYRIWARPY